MTSLPVLTEALSKSKLASGLVRIWENRLRYQKSEEGETSKEELRTVLSVTFMKMANLIPQDAIHPLYHPDYTDLTIEFILDHISTQTFDSHNPSLNSEGGLLMKTMSGKSLIFRKKEDSDKYYVNDIEILACETLPNQTTVISIGGFLFNHYEKTQDAFKAVKGTGKCYHR